MKRLAATFLFIAIFAGCGKGPDKYDWRVVASPGNARIVYVAPEGFADKQFISELLGHLVDRKKVNKILLFDSTVGIPSKLPLTDAEKLHWKGQYEFNPVTGYERYDSVHIVNPKTKPVEIYLQRENISPAP